MAYPHYAPACADHHDLVRDFGGPRPPITVLCGSTRFYDAFRDANLLLTLEGHMVLSIGCDTTSDADLEAAQRFGIDIAKAKMRLDQLHVRKIDLADEVLVLNVGGYIGESTRSEIEYANRIGRPVRYLEPHRPRSARQAGFAAGDVVRNRRTGELLTVTGDPTAWDPHYYEPADTADTAVNAAH